jgi:hypothetical protein
MARRDDDPFEKMAYPPGSLEATRRDLYPNMQAQSDRQRTHIMSPSMSFKTDIPEDVAFLKMLRVLKKADYEWLARYRGPKMGIRIPRGETINVNRLIAAFETVPIKKLPLTGIEAVLVNDSEDGSRARVKVNSIGRTKVKLKIVGTIRISDWTKLHRKVNKRLEADK